jgi:hypothetical protein
MIAYDYPLLGIFWTIMMLFIWIAWFGALFSVIGDIFRSDDLGGAAKAGWTVGVVMVPLLGLMIYLLTRGEGMQGRKLAEERAKQANTDAFVRDVSSSSDPADELTKLNELRSNGVITQDEFDRHKAKMLS